MILFVGGTRPEFIKLGPIADELGGLGVGPYVLATGQHSDLLKGTPAETDLANAESLGLASGGDVQNWMGKAVPALYRAYKRLKPSVVVVQGDTMSAYAGALAAKTLGIPVAHIEAGVRSHDLTEPEPEERFRVAIAQIASQHYAPTKRAVENLLAEGIPKNRIVLSGNPVVSALARYANAKPVEKPENQVLITMHRREWLAKGERHVRQTVNAFVRAAQEHPETRFLWPMHPVVLKTLGKRPWEFARNLLVTPPLAYAEAVGQLGRSIGVATDSGGLQEESATLGVPCAVLRRVTDRPESVEAGVAELFYPGPMGVAQAIHCLITRQLPRKPIADFGTIDSARIIALHLANVSRETSKAA
jgi:UDP-N-acetylglucosamine 2-epimerase (non-hydrolysing)